MADGLGTQDKPKWKCHFCGAEFPLADGGRGHWCRGLEVKAQPEPAGPGLWHVGSKVPLNVYKRDRPICQCHTAEDAAEIVDGMNSQRAEAKTAELIATLIDERNALAAQIGNPFKELRRLLKEAEEAEASMHAGMEPIRQFHELLAKTAADIVNPQGRWDRKIKAQAAEIQRLRQALEAERKA